MSGLTNQVLNGLTGSGISAVDDLEVENITVSNTIISKNIGNTDTITTVTLTVTGDATIENLHVDTIIVDEYVAANLHVLGNAQIDGIVDAGTIISETSVTCDTLSAATIFCTSNETVSNKLTVNGSISCETFTGNAITITASDGPLALTSDETIAITSGVDLNIATSADMNAISDGLLNLVGNPITITSPSDITVTATIGVQVTGTATVDIESAACTINAEVTEITSILLVDGILVPSPASSAPETVLGKRKLYSTGMHSVDLSTNATSDNPTRINISSPYCYGLMINDPPVYMTAADLMDLQAFKGYLPITTYTPPDPFLFLGINTSSGKINSFSDIIAFINSIDTANQSLDIGYQSGTPGATNCTSFGYQCAQMLAGIAVCSFGENASNLAMDYSTNIGYAAGYKAGISSTNIGREAGNNPGAGSVNLGDTTGRDSGANSINLGKGCGFRAPAGSISLSSLGSTFTPAGYGLTNGLYATSVNPNTSTIQKNKVFFNPTSYELSYNPSNFGQNFFSGNVNYTGLTTGSYVTTSTITLPFGNSQWSYTLALSSQYSAIALNEFFAIAFVLNDGTTTYYPSVYNTSAGNYYATCLVDNGTLSNNPVVTITDSINLTSTSTTTFNIQFFMKNSRNISASIDYSILFTCIT